MKPIDIPSLTAAISAGAPSGPDLEYDPGFLALEEAARNKPELQYGEMIVTAEEPEWTSVRDLAVDVLSRSKDLRAAVYLVQALTNGNGLAGLAQGLALVRTLVETFWDTLHPQMDPGDDLDPTARVNIVASLCDPTNILPAVRGAPMIQVPGLGGIALRTLQIAKGQAPASDNEETLKLDTIESAARDVGLSALQEAAACVDDAARDAAVIEQLLMEKVGVTHAVSLAPLTDTLREIKVFFTEQLDARGIEKQFLSEVDGDATSGKAALSQGQKQGISGDITCAQDVTNAIDRIVAYYKANEPSSPVPLLLQRAKRLVSVGFMEALRDIAPDAMSQAEIVVGVDAKMSE